MSATAEKLGHSGAMVSMSATAPDAALAAATALHLGFQLTISAVTYPALLSTCDEAWAATHADHGRRITPVVAIVYAAVLGALSWALSSDPTPGVILATLGSALSLSTTAFVAAPTHSALASGRTPRQVRRLRSADALRTAGALVAALGAFGAATGGL